MAAIRTERVTGYLAPVVLSLLLFTASLPMVLAAGTSSSANTNATASANMSYKLENPLAAKSIPEAIGKATRIFIGVSGSLALLAFIWGGLLMLTSSGSEERVKKGKQILVMSTIGLIIIFASYALLKTIFTVFGLS